MSGSVREHDVERRLGLAGAADDAQPVADAQQPGQALPDPIVGVDDDDTERVRIARGRIASRRWCGSRRGGRNGPSAMVASAERRGGLRHPSRIETGRPRPGVGAAGGDRGVRHDDLDRGPLARARS